MFLPHDAIMRAKRVLQRMKVVPVERRGQFAPNIIANLASFLVSVFIGLWYTPYLISHLGVAAYGLIPLAITVTSYFGLATITLNGAVGRFLIIALERKDTIEANRIFNTALVGNVIVVCVLFVPGIIVASHASAFFNVPGGFERSFGCLLFCIICSFFLTVVSSVFSLGSYCRNRFDLSSTVELLGNLVRISTIVALFTCFLPRIWHIGVGALAAGVFATVSSVIICQRLMPMVHVRPGLFNLQTLRELSRMGWWFFVSQIGALLFLGIDLIVVNKMFGAEAGGRYGAVAQWPALIRSLGGVIAGVFGPTILMLYARHNIPGLVLYCQQAVRFLGLAMALPIGLICGFSSSLLSVWLGPKFASMAPLMSVMTIHLSVNLGVLPLFNIRVATNKVRVPGIVTCVMGVVNLGLALLLAGPAGLGMYGVAAAGAIVLTSVNVIFGPWYAAHILGIPGGSFFGGTFSAICAALALTAASWSVSRYFQIASWTGLIVGGGGIAVVYSIYIFRFGLNKAERGLALAIVRRYLRQS